MALQVSDTIKQMYNEAKQLIAEAQKIIVIQAENPDGDSLASALALEDLLADKDVVLYCPVEIPKYLRYIPGWDRVVGDFDTSADLAIIVDTAADVLLSKVLEARGARHFLESHPVLVIDHHTTESNLSFPHTMLSGEAISTGEVIFNLSKDAGWEISKDAAELLLASQLADSLGLSTQGVTPESYRIAAELTELGAHVANIEERRREFMKKAPEILKYKGELLQRIEYFLNGKLALVHIPFEEIEQYSDKYNPSVLVLDEMRLVDDVQVAIAIKTYPDGKLTGKLRSNKPVSEAIAGYFGGGGHQYAAGFRVYEDYDKVVQELLTATEKAFQET